MLSIEHCKKRLEKYGKKYTDEQVKEIREFLYQLAELQKKDYESRDNNKIEIRKRRVSPP